MKCKDCNYADKKDVEGYDKQAKIVEKFWEENNLSLHIHPNYFPKCPVVKCYRYPIIAKKHPNDFCGEFKKRIYENEQKRVFRDSDRNEL